MIVDERVEIGTQRVGGDMLFPQSIAMAFAMTDYGCLCWFVLVYGCSSILKYYITN